MKLLVAIVNNDDAYNVNANLNKSGYPATKIASTGGFLMSGNSTFLIGVKDEDVDNVITIIGNYCKKRVQAAPSDMYFSNTIGGSTTSEVTVGGATIFVLNVESCYRV